MSSLNQDYHWKLVYYLHITDLMYWENFLFISKLSTVHFSSLFLESEYLWHTHKTIHKPSTALVEKKARFFVSSGFSWVKSGPRLCGSDSPVSEELSTLKPRDSIIRISAGIRSPNFTSTTSPSTMSSARSVNFSPSRRTVANCSKHHNATLTVLI